MKKEKIKIIITVILLIIIDQLIKFLVVKGLGDGNDIVIIHNFFKFTYVTNTGAALGMFSSNLLGLIIVSITLIWYIIKEIQKNNNMLNLLSLTLILSGALGNLIDRLFRGYVVDYISFTIVNKEMPVFNFADMLITFGICILFYIIIKEGKNDKKSK